MTGSWLVVFTLPGATSPALSVLLTCHSDGTATAMMPGFGDSAGAGSWTSAGDGQFAVTTLHYDQNPPPSDNPVIGFLKIRYSIKVGASGNLTGTAEGIQTDLSGTLVQDITGVTLTGSAIAVEQIGAPATGTNRLGRSPHHN